MRDLHCTDQLFESQVIHDLRVYFGQMVSHARDTTGAEVNAIVEYPEGPVLLVEVKLEWHSQVIDQAAKSLTRFADKIDPSIHPDNIRVIITGGRLAFRRPDGAGGPARITGSVNGVG